MRNHLFEDLIGRLRERERDNIREVSFNKKERKHLKFNEKINHYPAN